MNFFEADVYSINAVEARVAIDPNGENFFTVELSKKAKWTIKNTKNGDILRVKVRIILFVGN